MLNEMNRSRIIFRNIGIFQDFSPCFRVSCTLALLLKFWHDGKAFCWGSELFIPPKMAHRAHSYWMFMDVHGIKLIALRGLN
jgi:hypothetical protein